MPFFSRKPRPAATAEKTKPADLARQEFLKQVGAATVGVKQLLPALYDRRGLLASSAWQGLDRTTQSRLTRLLDEESPLRMRAQRGMVHLMAGTDWQRRDERRVDALLRAFPLSDKVLPAFAHELVPEPGVTGKLRGRPQGPFPSKVDDARGAQFAAEAFVTSIGGCDVTLYCSPVGSFGGLVNFDLHDAQQALMRVEARARRQLTKVIFAPTASPADTARLRKGATITDVRFVEVNEKGEAIVWSTPVPRRSPIELARALSDEAVLPTALRLFAGERPKPAAWDAWREACRTDGVFFSRAARETWERQPADDFAETVALAFATGLDGIRAVSPGRGKLIAPVLAEMYRRFGLPEAPIHG